jgi:hypothetical protein
MLSFLERQLDEILRAAGQHQKGNRAVLERG